MDSHTPGQHHSNRSKGNLKGAIMQCRYRLLEAECLSKRVPIEYLCESVLEMAADVEKHESQLPLGSRLPDTRLVCLSELTQSAR